MNKAKILVISGPTASGKSQLAFDLAQKKDIAIINADSLQIYEGLPILSAQPSEVEKKQVEHLLYSSLKPHESSSVALWLKLVKSSVEEVLRKNKLPVIVGGSGMYISKLIEGISEIPETEAAIRIEAQELFDNVSKEDFILELVKLGEENIRVEKLDKHRLLRSYEVIKQTKKSIFTWQNQPLKKLFLDEDFLHVNLNPNREILYKNCNERFKIMLKNGAIAEVENLIEQGISDEKQITKTLGFYEISDFLNQRITKEEAIISATQKTRNYAKRQLTWFRNQLPNKFVFENIKQAHQFLSNEI